MAFTRRLRVLEDLRRASQHRGEVLKPFFHLLAGASPQQALPRLGQALIVVVWLGVAKQSVIDSHGEAEKHAFMKLRRCVGPERAKMFSEREAMRSSRGD
jgi:hypothetical protein